MARKKSINDIENQVERIRRLRNQLEQRRQENRKNGRDEGRGRYDELFHRRFGAERIGREYISNIQNARKAAGQPRLMRTATGYDVARRDQKYSQGTYMGLNQG
ncbi:MAG: hypothetical protein LIP02_04050 [Bacteroidales bacterium]|nr:hypothetical protein [Bacteroidales bacterium]